MSLEDRVTELEARLAERDATIARLREWVDIYVEDFGHGTHNHFNELCKHLEPGGGECDCGAKAIRDIAALAEQPSRTPDPRDATIARLTRAIERTQSHLSDMHDGSDDCALRGGDGCLACEAQNELAALAEQPAPDPRDALIARLRDDLKYCAEQTSPWSWQEWNTINQESHIVAERLRNIRRRADAALAEQPA